MSENHIIKLADCAVGMPLQVVSTGELLIVTEMQGGVLHCTNLTTLLSNEYDLSIVNRSSNLRKASEAAIREQAEKEITEIRNAIAEHRETIEKLEKAADEKVLLLKAVREYEK